MTAQTNLAAALIAALDDDALDALASLLASRLTTPEAADGWMDARVAAAYLGLPSVDQLHKLTAARRVAFSQERPGAKCYFRARDLDAYRERHLR